MCWKYKKHTPLDDHRDFFFKPLNIHKKKKTKINQTKKKNK